jgi:hypothetical protein
MRFFNTPRRSSTLSMKPAQNKVFATGSTSL